MSPINRRDVFRSASVLLAMPFAGALVPVSASEPTGLLNVPQFSRFKLSRTATTAVSPDLLNFVKDHSARTLASRYQGTAGDYTALGDHFHMLGKHLSLAGADKLVKAHCRKLLRTGTVPAVDPQAIAHAVACVQVYAPSYSAKELLSSSAIPASPQEWRVELKKLRKKGVVSYLHQAARQLKAMGRASRNQPIGVAHSEAGESYKPAAYDVTDATQTAHVVKICSLSQKAKFFACIGASVAAGAIVLAAIAAICGATGLLVCVGAAFPSASVGVAVFFSGLGLITSALIASCSAFLSSYEENKGPAATLSAI